MWVAREEEEPHPRSGSSVNWTVPKPVQNPQEEITTVEALPSTITTTLPTPLIYRVGGWSPLFVFYLSYHKNCFSEFDSQLIRLT